jgi:hypothetical protein
MESYSLGGELGVVRLNKGSRGFSSSVIRKLSSTLLSGGVVFIEVAGGLQSPWIGLISGQ